MKIYNYHPEYKYFVSEGFADPSPLDPPGVWLIPAHATAVEAPNYSPGYIPVFDVDENSWRIIKDNRGIWYDTDTRMEIIVDDPNFFPLNATRKIPPEPPTPKDQKKIKWENDNWVLEDVPLPDFTPEQKLANAGLTVEELKTLLGLQ